MYSQNNEEQVILDYFKELKGNLLSIGENDGKTLSNALALIELGWKAVLVEPSPTAFKKLSDLHKANPDVTLCNVAIGKADGKAILSESKHHFPDKSDVALLSTLIPAEKERWFKVDFTDVEVDVVTYPTFISTLEDKDFDFISIDAEGMDYDILTQIDLTYTKCLCIEHNSNMFYKELMRRYCAKFGLDKLIYQSGENIILVR